MKKKNVLINSIFGLVLLTSCVPLAPQAADPARKIDCHGRFAGSPHGYVADRDDMAWKAVTTQNSVDIATTTRTHGRTV